MDKYIEVGHIVNTHGLKGEVKVNPWTDSPDVFEAFERVFTEDGREYLIEGIKYQKNCVLLKLSGIDSIDDAERMRSKTLFAQRELFDSLPENTYLVADIIGLTVKDEAKVYGVISDVISTGSNDVYVVSAQGARDILIPAVKEVVLDVNIGEGYVLVKIPDGLID